MSIEIRRIGPLVLSAMVMAMLVVACGPGNESGDSSGAVQDKPQGNERAVTAPADPQILAEGKTAWRSCAKCHCATDLRIKEDEDWVVLNEETSCIESGKPAPRLRKSIISYLRHPGTLRPVLVTRDFKGGGGKKTGKILVPATGGSAYLRADRESIKKGAPTMVRLYWGETGEEKTLAAPAGKYNVINFWLYRGGGKQGEERWMVTGTNVDGCAELNLVPEAGETLDLDPLLYCDFTAKLKDGEYSFSFTIHDIAGNRMTLSKNGRVVMPGYCILGEGGKTVAEGRFGVI